MSPLPADTGPFVARARQVVAVPLGAADLAAPFIAGAGIREERESGLLRRESSVEALAGPVAAVEADLPWLSESVSALSGLAGSGEELIVPAPAEPALESPELEDSTETEQWDDELGTFPLSEELPEPSFGETSSEWDAAGAEGAAQPGSAPVTAPPTPSAALEGVAQRLERIARVLRERGPTAALEENASDPLGALITGYVLGMSGAEKSRE